MGMAFGTSKNRPHKLYSGLCKRIWSIGNETIGIVLSKKVKGTLERKHILLRREYVTPSRISVSILEARLYRHSAHTTNCYFSTRFSDFFLPIPTHTHSILF